eukprot:CAMPEP_0116863696 /NCGR_PEP_ID=MMETSP0418-20121206/24381_1 /TAXON_ID=1158023 /ORGANISM="Astrosyne radiata, Strain 13vi08-1A" /LENGTH=266 /DNA_ID=CAMNT_0004498777 /DNA_START=285 /DNA_END=1085 /DNA_ORIENTATION=+
MAMREARRYLVGARGDKVVALEYLKKTCQYRKETRVDLVRACFLKDYSYENQDDADMAAQFRSWILQDTAHQKVVVQGYDKSGCATLHLGNRTCTKMDDEAFLMTQIYMVERALAATEVHSLGRQEQMVVFLDAGCFQSKCAPSRQTLKQLVSILQNHYPQRLKSLVVLDPPFWLRTMYSVLSPFLDVRTRQKFRMARGEREQARVFQDVLREKSSASIESVNMERFVTRVPFSCGYGQESGRFRVAMDQQGPAEAMEPAALILAQ